MLSQKHTFEGKVQGVGFLDIAKQLALGFDIIGTIENVPNGNIELTLQGETEEVTEFIQELTENSPLSHHIKNHIQTDTSPLQNIKGFSISSNKRN